LVECKKRFLGSDGHWVFAHKNSSDGPQGNRDSEKITLLLQHTSVKDPKDDMTVNHGHQDFGSFAPPRSTACYKDHLCGGFEASKIFQYV
jgi:hypothetical protein